MAAKPQSWWSSSHKRPHPPSRGQGRGICRRPQPRKTRIGLTMPPGSLSSANRLGQIPQELTRFRGENSLQLIDLARFVITRLIAAERHGLGPACRPLRADLRCASPCPDAQRGRRASFFPLDCFVAYATCYSLSSRKKPGLRFEAGAGKCRGDYIPRVLSGHGD